MEKSPIEALPSVNMELRLRSKGIMLVLSPGSLVSQDERDPLLEDILVLMAMLRRSVRLVSAIRLVTGLTIRGLLVRWLLVLLRRVRWWPILLRRIIGGVAPVRVGGVLWMAGVMGHSAGRLQARTAHR